MSSDFKLDYIYGREEVCKKLEQLVPLSDVIQFVSEEINKLDEHEFERTTCIHYCTDLDEYFKTLFELLYLGDKEQYVVSNYVEKAKRGKTKILSVKFIFGKKNNDICIYYNPSSRISISELHCMYEEYVSLELFPKKY